MMVEKLSLKREILLLKKVWFFSEKRKVLLEDKQLFLEGEKFLLKVEMILLNDYNFLLKGTKAPSEGKEVPLKRFSTFWR